MSHSEAGRGAVSPTKGNRHSRYKDSHDSDRGGRSGYRDQRGRWNDHDRAERFGTKDRNSRDDGAREKFDDYERPGGRNYTRHHNFDHERDRKERHRSPSRSKESSRNSSRSPSRGKRTSGFDMAPPGVAQLSGPVVSEGNVGPHVPTKLPDLMFKGTPMNA